MKKNEKDSVTKKNSESTELRIKVDKKFYEAESKFVSCVRTGVYGKKR